MSEMTGVERIGNILRRRPVDRIGLFEHFWGDTLKKWRKEDYGYILHSDHSIPTTTEYETYRFFVDEGLRLGRF